MTKLKLPSLYNLIGLCLVSTSSFASVAERDLSTGTWEFRKLGDTEWLPATVPGSVHMDLLANGKIPAPFYRSNELNLQWIDKEDWQYLEILFKGLDTYADVYLNDTLILTADNFHRSWSVEVKKEIRNGENDLMIHFKSPIKKGLEIMEQAPFIGVVGQDAHQVGKVKGKVSVYARKPHYQYGWDWAPVL